MPVDFDMVPTTKLRGFHFRATVEQRIIANYPVPPAILAPLVPTDARLWTHEGTAWLSACFVQLRHVRPAWLPLWAGMDMKYLVHRTMAEVPFPDGNRRKAVLVVEAYAEPAVPRVMGRVLGGAPFRPARLTWSRTGETFTIEARVDGELAYAAKSKKGFMSRVFGTLAQADEAILGMAWGSSKGRAGWNLFPETHDPWDAYGLTQTTGKHSLLERLGAAGTEADHVIGMEDCPHEFGRTIRLD